MNTEECHLADGPCTLILATGINTNKKMNVTEEAHVLLIIYGIRERLDAIFLLSLCFVLKSK